MIFFDFKNRDDVFQYKPHYIHAVNLCSPKTATNREYLEPHPQTCNITGPREMSTADGTKDTLLRDAAADTPKSI